MPLLTYTPVPFDDPLAYMSLAPFDDPFAYVSSVPFDDPPPQVSSVPFDEHRAATAVRPARKIPGPVLPPRRGRPGFTRSVLGTRARMKWLRYAACVGEDPELFFPVGTTGPAVEDLTAAKRSFSPVPPHTPAVRPLPNGRPRWASRRTAARRPSRPPSACRTRRWVRDADEETEPLPEQAGTPTGRHVPAIPQKRRTDLTDDDIQVRYDVVETVNTQRDTENEPEADGGDRRRRLMTIGHDPLKPPQ